MIFFAQVAANQGDIVVNEANEAGASRVRLTPSGVQFSGDLEVGYRFTMSTRVASRVLQALWFDEGIHSADGLYEACLDLPWEEVISLSDTFHITQTVQSCNWLKNSNFAALRLKDAIADHMRALNETGFSCADEMLYPENHKYLSDLLSYVAVGARSVEDQQHRLTASGLDIPVGMKNPTGGNLGVMMNALQAAQSPQTFIYRNWEVESRGNLLSHAILRGYVDARGNNHPNYHYEDLEILCGLYAGSGLRNPAVIVDTNHSNSGKKYLEQIRIAKEVLHSTRCNPDIYRLVKGLMIESYIEDGCQKAGEGVYGKSITDPCLGWEKTERLIDELAELR